MEGGSDPRGAPGVGRGRIELMVDSPGGSWVRPRSPWRQDSPRGGVWRVPAGRASGGEVFHRSVGESPTQNATARQRREGPARWTVGAGCGFPAAATTT